MENKEYFIISAICLVHLPVANALVTYNLLSPIPNLFYDTGSVAALSCNLGFVVNGSSTTKCTSKGSCIVIPDALSTGSNPNRDLTCGPASHKMGTIMYIPDSTSQKFRTGAVALLSCPFGQKVIGGASQATCQDGKWSAKLGNCEEAKLKLF
uniref:Sushi domain-containing protein n=1 Tax=Setaria digitata TaxID=48799 RepID=A0A915PXL0_9BILA